MFTAVEEEAATGFEILIKDQAIPHDKLTITHTTTDVAKGAGGKWRYIRNQYEPNAKKVIDIHFKETTGAGFGVCTIDINGGRGGRTLFLCWLAGNITCHVEYTYFFNNI